MSGATAERKLIVVADDDDDIRNLVRIRLEHAGFEVVTAEDGAQAISITRERHPALCVFDIQMPELNGYQVVEQIRDDPALADIPVILLTASVQERDISLGFEAGADDYIRKPFDPADLQARIAVLLERS